VCVWPLRGSSVGIQSALDEHQSIGDARQNRKLPAKAERTRHCIIMAATNASDGAGGEGEANPGEAALLVSEFPPPPFYYTEAANLKPPEIPKEALERGTRRAAAAAARARAEAERLRLAEYESDKTADVLGGVLAGSGRPSEEEEEDGEVVGVFGEIVEDPLRVQPLDACEDPTVIRDEVKRLNRQVLQGFVKLVQDLVNRPADNK
jgi:hypothetical protein